MPLVSTARYPVFILAGSFICLILLMAFTFKQFREYERQTDAVEHTYRVIAALQEVKGYFALEIYKHRGYALYPNAQTEREIFEARSKLFTHLDTLNQLVAANASQARNTKKLIQMMRDTTLSVNRWGYYSKLNVPDRSHALTNDIIPIIASSKHDSIYNHIQQMLDHEHYLFLARSKSQSESARLTPLLFIALTTTALFFMIYAFWQIQREFSIKLKAQQDLQITLDHLKLRNEELERISTLTAHHLKEPLRKAQTFISRLSHQHALEPALQNTLERAEANLTHLNRLLQDLNLYSIAIREPADMELVDLNKVWKQVIRSLQSDISEADADVRLLGTLPSVVGQSENLLYIFRELLTNAMKYGQPDQHPSIEVWVTTDKNGTEHCVHFRDKGLGIEEAYHDRIFQMFERLHASNQYSGTGIGLAVCRRLMKTYGGHIRVDSQPGEGSTFTLVFPMSQKG